MWQKNILNRPVSSKDGTDLEPVASSSGCDVGHVRNFSVDPNSKEVGMIVGVSIQAFHLKITIPWSKIDAIDGGLKYPMLLCCIYV